MAIAPLARRGVGAADEHGDGGDGDADERDDKRHTPCLVWGETLSLHQRVEDGGHQEVSDAAA